MTKIRPSWYWIITCRYLGPALSLVLFIAGLVNMGRKGIGYTVWDKDKVCNTSNNPMNANENYVPVQPHEFFK